VWRWDQAEPFGSNPADEDPDSNSVAFDLPLRLPGQYYDKETSLHYNFFRDYDPSLGIYKQSDPFGVRVALNTYTYVAASPLAATDVEGLASTPRARGPSSLGDAFAKTRGGIAGKKDCADTLSCDWFNKAPLAHVDLQTHEKCKFLIPATAWMGRDYLECRDSCVFWLKEKCSQPRSSCPPDAAS